MAIASLRYRPNAAPPEESKAGYVVFSGDAHEYHYWRFRTDLKLKLIPSRAAMVFRELRMVALMLKKAKKAGRHH